MQRQMKLKKFDFDDIERNVDGFQNCRKADNFDVKDLRESIKKDGLYNDPIVRVYKDKKGKERVVLLAGHRRYQAISDEREELKKNKEDTSKFYDKISCSVFTGGLDEAFALNLAENFHRDSLNSADSMEAVSELCDRVGNQEQVAAMLSISQSQVSIYTTTYQGLCQEAFMALRHESIRLNQAKKLSRILKKDGSPDTKRQTEILEKILTKPNDSVIDDPDRKRTKTYRNKKEVEELRLTLSQMDDDEIDSDHRKSVIQTLRWYFCELATDEMLFRVEESDGIEVVEDDEPIYIPKTTKKRKKTKTKAKAKTKVKAGAGK
tara:strand:+ start:1542 stop:2504 length:963 start_codon:yes stop_codon:yes gene_type:complete